MTKKIEKEIDFDIFVGEYVELKMDNGFIMHGRIEKIDSNSEFIWINDIKKGLTPINSKNMKYMYKCNENSISWKVKKWDANMDKKLG